MGTVSGVTAVFRLPFRADYDMMDRKGVSL